MTDMDRLVDALGKFHIELSAWLDAGGDKRLVSFDPLDTWVGIIGMIAGARSDQPVALNKQKAEPK